MMSHAELMESIIGPPPMLPPEGYVRLPSGWEVRHGDIWRRPTDGVWIQTGVAHWGTAANLTSNVCARTRHQFINS